MPVHLLRNLLSSETLNLRLTVILPLARVSGVEDPTYDVPKKASQHVGLMATYPRSLIAIVSCVSAFALGSPLLDINSILSFRLACLHDLLGTYR